MTCCSTLLGLCAVLIVRWRCLPLSRFAAEAWLWDRFGAIFACARLLWV